MIDYARGEVFWVKLPHVDSSSPKIRPGLVVSSGEYHEVGIDLIMVQMTTRSPRDEFDYVLRDWRDAGLNREGTVRCGNIFMIESTQLKEKIGSVSDRDLEEIESRLENALGL